MATVFDRAVLFDFVRPATLLPSEEGCLTSVDRLLVMNKTKSKRAVLAGIGVLVFVVALGGMMLFGTGKKAAARAPVPAPDVRKIRDAAEGGSATAQNVLGDLYAKGEESRRIMARLSSGIDQLPKRTSPTRNTIWRFCMRPDLA